MKIKQLSLKNFRNYTDATFEFTNNLNIIVGANAQGKTSLIEAIYALSTTKSHRTSKDIQMVRINEEFAKINATFFHEDEDINILLNISKKGKTAKYNQIPVEKLSAYVGKLKTVFFAPENLDLIKGAPAIRRQFLNIAIGQMDAYYIHHLMQYSKILKQRNELLKNFIANDNNNLMLEVLTEQLMPHSLYIIDKRNWFLSLLGKFAQVRHASMSDGQEQLQFVYQSSIKEEKEDAMLAKFSALYAQDQRMRTTTMGPHRDDFDVLINEMDAHDFASQGQQRTAVLSIKLAEIDVIHEVTGIYPVLLLDDVLSELDAQRQQRLLSQTVTNGQIFITTTSIDAIDKKYLKSADIFSIEEGNLKDFLCSTLDRKTRMHV